MARINYALEYDRASNGPPTLPRHHAPIANPHSPTNAWLVLEELAVQSGVRLLRPVQSASPTGYDQCMQRSAFQNGSSPNWAETTARPRVALLGLGGRDEVLALADELRPAVEQAAQVVFADLRGDAPLPKLDADFIVVIGGDGSILRTAQQMGAHQIPLLGVNMGKLGFLADIPPHEFDRIFPEVCSGRCRVVEHLMLRSRVYRGEQLLADRIGLNEVAVLGGAPFSILDLNLYVDGELATTYNCDGLIIATPVGSTAHSLSAGGPILRKELDAFVILPISPHTLTMRAVVDSADRVYEVSLCSPNAATWVVVDGRVLHVLTEHDHVVVERAQPKFQMIEVAGHGYYGTLREKLGWSGRISGKKGEGGCE